MLTSLVEVAEGAEEAADSAEVVRAASVPPVDAELQLEQLLAPLLVP